MAGADILVGNGAKSVSVGDLLVAWAQSEETPKLIVDQSLNLIWANQAADRELSLGTPLHRIDGIMGCSDHDQTLALRRFVGDCSEALSTFWLPDPSREGHLLFRGWRIGQIGSDRAIGLIFFRSASSHRANYADLKAAFGLTPTQEKVILLLLDGKTAEEITTVLRISMETVRTHIRGIYAKLKVGSREAMFCKLQPYKIL